MELQVCVEDGCLTIWKLFDLLLKFTIHRFSPKKPEHYRTVWPNKMKITMWAWQISDAARTSCHHGTRKNLTILSTHIKKLQRHQKHCFNIARSTEWTLMMLWRKPKPLTTAKALTMNNHHKPHYKFVISHGILERVCMNVTAISCYEFRKWRSQTCLWTLGTMLQVETKTAWIDKVQWLHTGLVLVWVFTFVSILYLLLPNIGSSKCTNVVK